MILEELKEMADIAGAAIGVEVHSVERHPSLTFVLHTSVGKGYLADDLNSGDREAVVEALGSTLQLMKDIADGKYATDTYTLTSEQMETCLDALSQETTELSPEPGSAEDDAAAMSIETPEVQQLNSEPLIKAEPVEVKPKRGRKAKTDESEPAV